MAIVRDAAGAATASRVESELADLGIFVRTLFIGSDVATDEPLSAIGERTGAAAAIRIRADRTVEVWAAGDPTTEPIGAQTPSGDGDRLIAIAAAELVRARLLGAAFGSDGAAADAPAAAANADAAPTPTAVSSPAPTAAVASPDSAPRPPRVSAQAGPAILASGLDLAPTVNVFLAVAVVAAKPLSIELFGATPLAPTRAQTQAGSMRMHTALAGGGLRFVFGSRSGFFSFLAAPGFAALVLLLDGRAADGYEARSDTVATAAPILRLGASIRLASRLRLGLDALAGVALSEVAVRIGGREAARIGRPILGAALCLEVTLW